MRWLAVVFSALACWMSCVSVSLSGAQSVGTAINLFSRYGYLSISMRVVPRNDSDQNWIFREPSVQIFHNLSSRVSRSVTRGDMFQGDFHMEFCDNVRQLLQAYFRDFSMELIEKPWQAFTGSWTKNVIARNLGINNNDLSGDYSFVLIRVSRHREVANVLNADKVRVEDVVNDEIKAVKIGDENSVIEFIRSFGSHYISSYITGNSLYQVFVYEPDKYRLIKSKLKEKGISQFPSMELLGYFSPLYAKRVGKIQCASGNTSLEQWASRHLQLQFFSMPFYSLLKLHANVKLLYELDALLGNEALLKLDLRVLTPIFQSKTKRAWFQEVMDNHIRLWEVNM